MTETELHIDFHKNARRQGPGSVDTTLKALELTGIAQKESLNIADIGCGTGSQTIVLAQNTNAQIKAVDLFPDFLEKLDNKTRELGLQQKVTTLSKSMDDLPFGEEEFDIVWSEGAIYNMGFEAGIKSWKKFIKAGGYLCVSEITWISESRPKELEEYWRQAYPEIDKASNKIKLLENNGFTLAGYLYLGQDSWIDNYYNPMKERFPKFLERHNHSEMAKAVVREYEKEIEHYHTNKDHFSYGFYIARKEG